MHVDKYITGRICTWICRCRRIGLFTWENSLLMEREYQFVERMTDGMQREKELESPLEMRRPLAMRALRRSSIRKRVAEYLFDISPSYSYTSDIAYHVRTTPSNVIGAMKGMQTRYKREESLMNLGIITEKICGNNNIRLYGITDFGKEMLKTLEG